MKRQSITKIIQNEELEAECSRNHARNQQKQIDWIKLKLEKAEESGFTTETKAQILKHSKDLLNAKLSVK